MQLTRKRVIATAIELIEHDGVEAASMARLATELGCGVLLLYGLVPSKADLLDGVADEIVSGIVMATAPDVGWQDQVRALAWAFRQLARVLPQCAVVALTRPVVPASAVRLARGPLSSMRDAGFAGQEAMRIMRVVATYVKGAALTEARLAPVVGTGGAGDGVTKGFRLAEDFQLGLEDDSRLGLDEDFELGLDLLIRAVTT
jgi:AcrR family transcriptional regulator